MTVAAFDWSEPLPWAGPGAIDGVVEDLAGDRLDRARYAEFLSNYLAAEGKQRNYVLNLNAEWGAGKTWFIKRWYMELKECYPTVYIDAWQQDFSDDPLLTVISSIIDQLRDATGNNVAVPDGIKSRLLGLLKVGGKLVIKSAIKKAGLEDGDFSLEGEDADKLVDTLCSNHRERYESIQYLKKEIRQWVEAAVSANLDQLDDQGRLDYPAFILIDELDRCRPSYAVEMLETIKHIFDISGVVFVLATDTEQLQHAIKVIYGEGFDAESYLGRFFHRRFTLGSISRREFIQQAISDKALHYENINVWPEVVDSQVLINILSAICDHFSLNLRKTEQVLDRTIASILNYNGGRLNLVFLVYLFSLCERSYEDYRAVADGKMPATDSHPKLKGFNVLVNEYGEQHFPCFIKPGSTIGHYFEDANERYLNPFKDGEFLVSLRIILAMSYDSMLNSISDGGYSYRFISLTRDCSNRMRKLTVEENSLLAEKELSQLERRLATYKNLVELAVHLD
ncbi:KAP family P-loop domain-containing protein [Aeromonas diversa CDC 2478-85]|uniref:KAP family P-loop domain-containing protein n=1 Tax=Aeromonas diversa CDC 2478-85 TaxID=1268237 RepID=N9VK21_9GAMM|nr:P-loop NTPase fold protein [Aeromonas diversa]ENY71983.1 KAP family P-loop domain-containing protein [Aeromonas diversa CDC 2478-85]